MRGNNLAPYPVEPHCVSCYSVLFTFNWVSYHKTTVGIEPTFNSAATEKPCHLDTRSEISWGWASLPWARLLCRGLPSPPTDYKLFGDQNFASSSPSNNERETVSGFALNLNLSNC